MTKVIGLLVVTLVVAGVVAASSGAKTTASRTCIKRVLMNTTYITFQGRDALWACKRLSPGPRYYGKAKGTVLCGFMSRPPRIFSVIVRSLAPTQIQDTYGQDICGAFERNRLLFKIG
jgi:hypothetical protein